MHDRFGLHALGHEDRTDAGFGKDASRKRAEVKVVVEEAAIDDCKILATVPSEELALMDLVPCHVSLERP